VRYFFSTAEASDYRPVLNADATVVIFERTFKDHPNVTKLYSASLIARTVQQFVDIASFRPDWCWHRVRGHPLTSGPVAFSNDDGIYRVNGDGSNLMKLRNTKGMVYPSWYPDCQYIAADVVENVQIPGEHLIAQVDAMSGVVVAAPLANNLVWAGFPSVDQVNPSVISFAGQFKGEASYYNEPSNYTWVTDRSILPAFSRKESQVRRRLSAGGRWIRTFGSPIDPLPFSRKQCRSRSGIADQHHGQGGPSGGARFSC
jgi:hypothetical protein